MKNFSITFQQVSDFINEMGYTNRSQRYVAARQFFMREAGLDIDEPMFKAFDTFHRYFRDDYFFPKDKVGEREEKTYHASPGLHRFNNEMKGQNALFKTNILSDDKKNKKNGKNSIGALFI